MIVELRAVPDCPNLSATRDLLQACVVEAGLAVSVIVERIGDYPSPSVLVDGADVTGADPNGPAACVLAMPTAAQIRAALSRTAAAGDGDDTGAAAAPHSCPPADDPIRSDRPVRAAALPAPLRWFYQRLLCHFATVGAPPATNVLEELAAEASLRLGSALAALAADDLVAFDAEGRLLAAYPFSPVPTAHVVDLGGVRVFAMCAIDALGMPAMLDRDATITSRDPHTNAPVTVRVTGGAAVFEPATTVVVYAASGAGRSVDTCCSTINFFTDPASAVAWIAAHPQAAAAVLDQVAAVALGRDIFGPLLGASAS